MDHTYTQFWLAEARQWNTSAKQWISMLSVKIEIAETKEELEACWQLVFEFNVSVLNPPNDETPPTTGGYYGAYCLAYAQACLEMAWLNLLD